MIEPDTWCSLAVGGKLEEQFKKGGVNYQWFWYDADHAFVNETRPEVCSEYRCSLSIANRRDFKWSHELVTLTVGSGVRREGRLSRYTTILYTFLP
jgi:hypothetical protein